VRIDESALAGWFKEFFEGDWEIPEMEMPPGMGVEPELRPDGTFVPALLANIPDKVFDIKHLKFEDPITVTPILSPNNYSKLVIDLIKEATVSIDLEQQYVLASGPKTEALLSALEQRRNDLEIRIIVSPAFRQKGKKGSWELSVDSLDAFHLKGCLRAMNLGFYTHLHNKGVIIDRKKVIVSSTNWSENSITLAREAGLLIESPEVAGYFADVFDFDWSIGWDPADVPDNILQLFEDAIFVPGGLEEIHPADMV
jgi:phosphatidylserine/phosphatidylglycerophosphate/cardiolipin synthase-like enzyme